MPSKRPSSPFSSCEESPQKRRARDLFTPRSSPPPPASSSSAPCTPRTPFPFAHMKPFDSPSNPFGRKRSMNLKLPKCTSFGKHLPLRMQVVDSSVGPPQRVPVLKRVGKRQQVKMVPDEGAFRIVQVPLNYTFRHLHKLILFLFDRRFNKPTIRLSSKEAKGKERARRMAEGNEDWKGHYFEVQKDVKMRGDSIRPGQIHSGSTWAKLSSVRDPFCGTSHNLGPDEDIFGSFAPPPGGTSLDEEERSVAEGTDVEEEEGWHWEAEEDFTLTHVWPKGGDLSRGLIYHHTSTRQVHISINTRPIPERKGTGNTPFVFRARGMVNFRPSRPVLSDDELVSDLEDDWEEVVENWTCELSQDPFNARNAFAGYLKTSCTFDRAHTEEDLETSWRDGSGSTPGSSVSISSPATCPRYEPEDEFFADSLVPRYIDTPSVTPAPVTRVHRVRVARVARRLVRATTAERRRIEDKEARAAKAAAKAIEAAAKAEEEEKAKEDRAMKRREEREIWEREAEQLREEMGDGWDDGGGDTEIEEDEDGLKRKEEGYKRSWSAGGKTWKWVWDPFGDEAEL